MTEYRFYSPAIMSRLVETKKQARLLAIFIGAFLVVGVFDGNGVLLGCAFIDACVLVWVCRIFDRLIDRAADIAITRARLARDVGRIVSKRRAA